MQIPAQKPWYQREGIQLANRIGMIVQDENSETLFFNLSTLGDPGVNARVISATHKTIQQKDHLVLHCEQCTPAPELPTMLFDIILPLDQDAPIEQRENMKIITSRRHPFIVKIVELLCL